MVGMVASRMPWGDGVAMCWVLPLSVVVRGAGPCWRCCALCIRCSYTVLNISIFFADNGLVTGTNSKLCRPHLRP